MFVFLLIVLLFSFFAALFAKNIIYENLLFTTSGRKHQIRNNKIQTRMWANAQPDGRPAEHRWRPLFNAAKFG